MHPVLFVLEVGGQLRPIGTFGLMMALAIVVGSVITVRAAGRLGIGPDEALAGCAVGAGAALFGSYGLDVLVRLTRGFPATEALTGGGLTFYGAPILGSLAVFLAARPLGIPFARFADAVVLAVPFAHALGRLGCFFAGCCHGRPTDVPWAVTFDAPHTVAGIVDVPVHPTQLYEAAGLLVLAGASALVPPRDVGRFRRPAAYAFGYAVLRLLVERFRGDVERGTVAFGLSTSEAVSSVVLVVAGAYLAHLRRVDGAAS